MSNLEINFVFFIKKSIFIETFCIFGSLNKVSDNTNTYLFIKNKKKMETRNDRIKRILANFDALNGTKFSAIRGYKNGDGEISNHVVNANFIYANAVNKSVEILNSLTAEDFEAIAEKYSVVNHSGEKYGTNKGARTFLAEGKLPKEGTKARETALNGVRVTKTLAEMRDEMVQTYLDNQNPETRSKRSEEEREKYEHVAKSVKRNKKSGKLHIYAMSVYKEVVESVEYKEKNEGIEASQKSAIFRYCKKYKTELPVSKYRNFIIDEEQLAEVQITGNTYTII